MGASLACAKVRGDNLVCPWHGLELGDEPHGRWRPLPTHDDGVLVWVRLSEETAHAPGEAPTPAPILAPRPARFLSGVVRMEAECDPSDILANRLDPWHGAHYHPHSFARLKVLADEPDRLLVRVAYRVFGPLAVEVDATFHCPDPRTIVMTIVGGEGVGSVVETHATPLGPGRCAVLEATLATSERPGFKWALGAGRLLRPLIERRAARLWVEDVAYAERRFRQRARTGAPADDPRRGGVGEAWRVAARGASSVRRRGRETAARGARRSRSARPRGLWWGGLQDVSSHMSLEECLNRHVCSSMFYKHVRSRSTGRPRRVERGERAPVMRGARSGWGARIFGGAWSSAGSERR
ncbi:DUF5914 domain-containing protein [Nannocystis pusilla]|uniref:DUF5914 domain-containing protein n=1 Tax=Nannocystis pusilla TaxID=889268 RepID=UPI003B7DC1E9